MKEKKHSKMMLAFTLSLFFVSLSFSQTTVTYGQLVSVLKTLKSDLKVIGVLSTSLEEKDVANFTRAAQGQGLEIYIAQPKDVREVSALYKRLVSEKKVQIIIIPSSADKMLMEVAFEYLVENSTLDKVGVCVPQQELLNQGAFCYIAKENGKFMAYVNERISTIVGAKIPESENPSITFVSR